MSINVLSVSSPAAPLPTSASSRILVKTNSQATSSNSGPSPSASTTHAQASGDTVQISSAATTTLTPAQMTLEETETYSQIVQAAANGDPTARSLLAAEAAGTKNAI